MEREIASVKGMHDQLPYFHNYFTFLKKVIRHLCRQRGIRRIETPILELAELFEKGTGESTDIVEKEMYIFTDKGGEKVALRPEFTPGICRAYLKHNMELWPQPVKLYSIGPVFRYGKPQKGRYRQFYQFDVEVIGESDPALDAELIQLGFLFYQKAGISENLVVGINSVGCPDCRKQYREDLLNFYAGKERNLCEDCQKRLKKNPLRLLDCKEEDCRILAEVAPKLTDSLCEECQAFHGKLKEYLKELKISFEENPNLVRGLDYYTRTVFEYFDRNDTGRQNALGGGGRYDPLIEIYGGEPTPAVGFALGIERVVEKMMELKVKVPIKDTIHVFVVQLGDEAKRKALSLITELRELGVKVVGSVGTGSIKSQLRQADKLEAPYALILGQIEVRDNVVILRDLKAGNQKIIAHDKAVKEIVELIGKENLDTHNFEKEIERRK